MFQAFVLLSLIVVFDVDVDADEVKSVSVTEGHFVTLHANLTDIQRIALILWKFGPKEALIVKINKEANKTSVYDDVHDGRFRGRLQVDDQTGSLNITNTRTTDTGVYQITISTWKKISYRFNVTVCEQPHNFLQKAVISYAVGGCVMMTAAILMFCLCRKYRFTDRQVETRGDITYMDPTFCKRQRHQPRALLENAVIYDGIMR